MANTSSRTLRLLSLLQTHRHWSGTDLAVRLDVSVRTLRRDVDRLRELGYPIDASRGIAGGYQLAPGAALPPLVLDDDEAVALAVALFAVTDSPIAGVAEASVRALAKIVQVMPKRLRRRIAAVQAMTQPALFTSSSSPIDSDLLTAVAQACRDTVRIEFGYRAADEKQSARRVEPHRLVSLGRRWYLVGYDLDRTDWRTFRLDRLSEPVVTGTWFAPRRLPATDAAAFVRAGLAHVPTDYEVEAVVDAPAAQIEARIGRWATVTARDAHTCIVHVRADSLDWVAMALGALGAPFRIGDAPELAAHLSSWSERFRAATAPA